MKAYIKTGNYRFTILSILIIILGPGCSLTRRLDANQSLVRKLNVKGVDKEFLEAATNYVDKQQQPNNWLNLQIYYTFNKNGKKNLGDPPAILDSSLVEFSRSQIERFLQSKGYLKAKVTDDIKIKNKRAELTFTATEGTMFRIRKIQDSIPDKKVRELYLVNRKRFSHIQPGGRFDTDSLAYDRDEFFLIMKRNGYFDFYRQYISYNYDSTFMSSVVDLKLLVATPAGKKAHPLYRLNNTEITISNSAGQTTGKADTLAIDSEFKYIDYSHRFKPKTVISYIFMRKGQLYDVDKQTLTTSRLSELNVFKNVPNPVYDKLPDSTNRLNSKIAIIPLKRMANRVEGEFLFNAGQYGYNIGNTFTDRDVFKSAAVLQIKLNWSVLYDKNRNKGENNVENQDFRIGGNLTYPFIISPFNFPEPGKYGVPHTTFSSNYQLFYQQNLVERTSLINFISYDFAETADKLHSITPIDIEFSRGVINNATRDKLLAANLYAYYYLIGRTIFTSGSQYAFTYNANKLNTYSDFMYFRGGADVGGNTLYLVSRAFNIPKDALGERTVAGRAFSQYVKGEFDLRLYKSLGGERQFVVRINPGVGVPYGNSTELIFEKNFYGGGANDMRAWLPRTLGPGQFNRASYYDNPYISQTASGADSLRKQTKYLDQFGEVKFISNFEYRYKIVNNFFGSKLKGAVFIDAGNVWRLSKQFITPHGDTTLKNREYVPNLEFRFNNFFQSTAIDIGTGLRFDLSFFVFRLDMAFKFKDPQFNGGDQWVLLKHADELFRSGAFKKNYSDSNTGDTYNFMQLNFGIGMPF